MAPPPLVPVPGLLEPVPGGPGVPLAKAADEDDSEAEDSDADDSEADEAEAEEAAPPAGAEVMVGLVPFIEAGGVIVACRGWRCD